VTLSDERFRYYDLITANLGMYSDIAAMGCWLIVFRCHLTLYNRRSSGSLLLNHVRQLVSKKALPG